LTIPYTLFFSQFLMSLQLFPTPLASRPGSPPHSQTDEQLRDPPDDPPEPSAEPTGPATAGDDQLSSHIVSAGNKRPAEDLSEYTAATLRRVRLKASGQTDLKYVSKLSPAQRSIWISAQILLMHDRLDNIQPVDAKWQIPETLWDKIEHFTFAGLVSPALPSYIKDGSPIRLVMGILEKHPQWGFTKEVKNNKSKSDVVRARVQLRLTDRRAAIKRAIMLSIGPPPPPLSSDSTGEETQSQAATAGHISAKKHAKAVRLDIVKLCAAIANEHSESEVVVTIQMCARFAFLRHVFVQSISNPALSGNSYWPLVDKQLDLLREQYPGDPGSVTLVLTMMLNSDRHKYGQPDTQHEPTETSAAPNATQRIADSAANGEFIEDDD